MDNFVTVEVEVIVQEQWTRAKPRQISIQLPASIDRLTIAKCVFPFIILTESEIMESKLHDGF